MRGWYLVALSALGFACNAADLSTSPNGTTTGTALPSADAGAAENTEDGGAEDEDGGQPARALAYTHDVTIQVQPTDGGKAILDAIKSASASVHMTMYLLTDDRVIAALAERKAAGKEVKVVLNKTFPPDGGDNQPAYDALVSKGIDVRWASSRYAFTHAKTIVIDGSKAIVMTMNLTSSSPRTNREYIATDSDAADVAVLERIFAADFGGGQDVTVASKLVVSPIAANENGSPRAMLAALIASATKTLDVEVQTLSDRTLVDGIVKAHTAGLDVHVLVDGDVSDTTAQVTVIGKLKTAGVPLRSLHTPDLHAKAVVVDGVRAFVGSQNFTSTALDANREIGVLTDAASEAAKVKAQIASDFAKGVDL